MLESIPGTAGIMVPPAGYLTGVRELCDRHGILLVADEVMSGFGRAGRWFACELDGVVPDLLTFAKGVNSGYVPLGGVAMSEAVAATFADRAYPGGLTYSGHPLACAAAVATIRTMEDDRVVEHAAALGEEVFRPGLEALLDGARLDRRGPRHRRLLGRRAGQRPRDPRAPRAVRRQQPADGRDHRRAAGAAGCCPSPTSTASTWCRR